MPRLRTTTGLSLLALAAGIAATGWLSALNTDWNGPPARYASATTHPAPVPSTPRAAVRPPIERPSSRHPSRLPPPVRVVRARHPPARVEPGEALAGTPAPAPALVPLSTPTDTSQPWYKLRGHLDGHVLLHVEVDGNGQVRSASLVESSGDAVLDQHALRSVRGWRFSVPADQPDGMAGELPMRFSSQGGGIARMP